MQHPEKFSLALAESLPLVAKERAAFKHFAAAKTWPRKLVLGAGGKDAGTDPKQAAVNTKNTSTASAFKELAQGKGLGTRFATMIHAFAFDRLEIERMYASVVPQNVASRRVFEKLGYVEDGSDAAREYGDEGDIVLAIARSTFHAAHASQLAEITIAVR